MRCATEFLMMEMGFIEKTISYNYSQINENTIFLKDKNLILYLTLFRGSLGDTNKINQLSAAPAYAHNDTTIPAIHSSFMPDMNRNPHFESCQ